MAEFDPSQYGALVAALLEPPREAELGPGRPNRSARAELASLTPEQICAPHRVADRDLAKACLSALWLYHDYLDESHSLSQEIPGTTGSFWHGIMHRREPDPSNAKYWFRTVGQHEIFPKLLAAAQALDPPEDSRARELTSAAKWDPFLFVDLCETARRSGGELEDFCRRVQTAEWQLLFDYCWRGACGLG
jgi:hypothetical protein